MRITRRFTQAGKDVYDSIEFRRTSSEIRNPDGSTVFQAEDIEVPASWSQVASDVLAQKYFRKRGVPLARKKVEENSVPSWLWRSGPRRRETEGPSRGPAVHRRDLGQAGLRPSGRHLDLLGLEGRLLRPGRRRPGLLSTRCVSCWPARWARPTRRSGSTPACTGLMESTDRARATTTSTIRPAKLTRSTGAYEHPQPHACFIQSVEDDLVNENGIMDLWVREARLFKYGSGTGTNFSRPPRRGRGAVRRRQVLGPDVLPEDRRPRGRRHQVRRHHPAGGQDGDRRHRPPGHRGLHQLEGRRGAEGGGAGRRLEALRAST